MECFSPVRFNWCIAGISRVSPLIGADIKIISSTRTVQNIFVGS